MVECLRVVRRMESHPEVAQQHQQGQGSERGVALKLRLVVVVVEVVDMVVVVVVEVVVVVVLEEVDMVVVVVAVVVIVVVVVNVVVVVVQPMVVLLVWEEVFHMQEVDYLRSIMIWHNYKLY